MGNDGGSIVGRAELVALKKRPVHARSVREDAKERANTCALSHEPLAHPVVVCACGNLYNKEAVIEYLLSKNRHTHLSHIQTLKDVMPVTLNWANDVSAGPAAANATPNADASKSAAAGIASTDPSSVIASLYTCPITALPSNGVNRFIAMQPCGCVLSERAWKSVGHAKDEVPTCLVCSKPVAVDPPNEAEAAAAASAAVAASSTAATAVAAPSSAAASPYHHPAYITICPGPEELLYVRGIVAERMRIREAEKAAAKAAKKAAKSAAAASAGDSNGTDAASASHKRKADGLSDAAKPSATGADSSATAANAPPSKRAHLDTAPSLARTGNTLADSVRSITAAAAASVAARRKDETFSSIFLKKPA